MAQQRGRGSGGASRRSSTGPRAEDSAVPKAARSDGPEADSGSSGGPEAGSDSSGPAKGSAGSGKAGSGKAGSGKAGSGKAGSGKGGFDKGGFAKGGGRQDPQAAAAHRVRLREVVEPVLAAAGYDVEDLSVSRVGRRHLVRIAVDSDTGVDLDTVADLSRQISKAIDDAEADGDELIAGEYELEVGSPGVDRPLTEPRHWRRNAGRLVAVKAGDKQVTGRVRGTDGDGVLLLIDGAERRFAYGDLGPGRVQIEFKRLEEIEDDDLEDFVDPEEDDA